MEKIKAPFTEEQVKNLNDYQELGCFHPFTCCSHDDCDRRKQPNEGRLRATTEGWVCPCGKWKQDWAHAFMADPNTIKNQSEWMRKLNEKQDER